jgi:hypothetical protein
MEAMLVISLYSYPYLNQQKCFVFLIIAYTFSSTILKIRAEQILPRSGGWWGGWTIMGWGGVWVGGRNGPNNV